MFKREAADVLYRHFSQQHPALPAPAAIVPAESLPQPEKPAPDAARSLWIEYHQQMVAWLRWQEDIEQWRLHVSERQNRIESRQDVIESRMEGVEELARMSVSEVSRLYGVLQEQFRPPTLSPAHQATTKHMVNRPHEVSGLGYPTIYGELNAAFHVGRYSDIPDDHWSEVAAWLTTRIEAAERKRRRPGE